MSTHVTPQYNALDGNEVAKLIAKQFYEKLAASSDFALNITYPMFVWEIQLTIKAWPQERPIRLEDGGELVVDPDAKSKIPVKKSSLKFSGNSSRAPDRDRDLTGLEKPRAAFTTGGMVDLPKTPVITPKK